MVLKSNSDFNAKWLERVEKRVPDVASKLVAAHDKYGDELKAALKKTLKASADEAPRLIEQPALYFDAEGNAITEEEAAALKKIFNDIEGVGYADALYNDMAILLEAGWSEARIQANLVASFDTVPVFVMEALRKDVDAFGFMVGARENATMVALVDQAVAEGWHHEELADHILDAFSDGMHIVDGDGNVIRTMDPVAWATMVARTELNRAQSLGAVNLYNTAGIERVMWATTQGATVCPLCAAADGDIQKLGDTFESVDVEAPPAHPNCCCALLPADEEIAPADADVNQPTPEPEPIHQPLNDVAPAATPAVAESVVGNILDLLGVSRDVKPAEAVGAALDDVAPQAEADSLFNLDTDAVRDLLKPDESDPAEANQFAITGPVLPGTNMGSLPLIEQTPEGLQATLDATGRTAEEQADQLLADQSYEQVLVNDKVMSITEISPDSSSDVYEVKFDSGRRGVFKPESGSPGPGVRDNMTGATQTPQEVGAWEIAKIVGLDDQDSPISVAPVVSHSWDADQEAPGGDIPAYQIGEFGSLATWADGEQARYASAGVYGNATEETQGRAAAFDFIIGNEDRHAKNWLVDSDGDLHLIDHGLSFPDEGPYGKTARGNNVWGNYNFVNNAADDLDQTQYTPDYYANVYVQNKSAIYAALERIGMSQASIDGVMERIDILEGSASWKDIDVRKY